MDLSNNTLLNMSDQDALKYSKTFPPGYRFQPTDEELIDHYLSKKYKGEPLPPNNIIPVDIYDYSPGALAEKYKEFWDKEWYFFTPRKRKYLNGERPNRSTGSGFWKATGADKPIVCHGECIGTKKALVFFERQQKTNWIMHEYRLTQPTTIRDKQKRKNNDMKLDDWVLCRIYENNYRSSNRGLPRSNQDSGEDHHQQNDGDKPNTPSAIDYEPNPSTLMCDTDCLHQYYEAESILQGKQSLQDGQDGLHLLTTNALDNFKNTDQSQAPLFNGPPQERQQEMGYNYININNFEQVQQIQEMEQQLMQQKEMIHNCINMDNFEGEHQLLQESYNYINMYNMQQAMLSCNYFDNYIEEQHEVLFDYGDQNNYLPPSYSTSVPVPYQDQFDLLPPGNLSYQHPMDNNVHQNGLFECNHEEDTILHP